MMVHFQVGCRRTTGRSTGIMLPCPASNGERPRQRGRSSAEKCPGDAALKNAENDPRSAQPIRAHHPGRRRRLSWSDGMKVPAAPCPSACPAEEAGFLQEQPVQPDLLPVQLRQLWRTRYTQEAATVRPTTMSCQSTYVLPGWRPSSGGGAEANSARRATLPGVVRMRKTIGILIPYEPTRRKAVALAALRRSGTS